MIVEVHERLHIVEIIADRHHTDATVEKSHGVWRMCPGMCQHDDIERARHSPRGARIDVDDGDVSVSVSEDAGEAARDSFTDNASPDEADGDHQRSGSSSGRQPPCCGGVPPVPRTRITVAVITMARMAPSDRRTNFMARG